MTKQDVEIRWQNGNGYIYNSYFYNAIKKYGWENISHEIIASNLTEEEACNFEKLLIKKLKSNIRNFGYNLTTGGEKGYSLNQYSLKIIDEKGHIVESFDNFIEFKLKYNISKSKSQIIKQEFKINNNSIIFDDISLYKNIQYKEQYNIIDTSKRYTNLLNFKNNTINNIYIDNSVRNYIHTIKILSENERIFLFCNYLYDKINNFKSKIQFDNLNKCELSYICDFAIDKNFIIKYNQKIHKIKSKESIFKDLLKIDSNKDFLLECKDFIKIGLIYKKMKDVTLVGRCKNCNILFNKKNKIYERICDDCKKEPYYKKQYVKTLICEKCGIESVIKSKSSNKICYSCLSKN